MPFTLATVALAALVGQIAAVDDSRLVFAAAQAGGAEWSARRLFNAGLIAEEGGSLFEACQFYLAARLTAGEGFADGLYAKGAGLRLLGILSVRDEDAATAAALQVSDGGRFSELEPVAKMLLHRLEGADGVEVGSATILSVRFNKRTNRVLLELESDGGSARIVDAGANIAPFSAGHRVRAMVRRIRGTASAGWRLVALSAEHAPGWQVLRVRGLTGEPVPAHGALLGTSQSAVLPFSIDGRPAPRHADYRP